MDVMLGEQQLAVEAHVEDTARALAEDRSDAEAPLDVGRQTGGAGPVVSNDAVIDEDFVHRHLLAGL
jgi:hypothetical protein